MKQLKPNFDTCIASLLGLSSFIVYVLTLSPDVVGGDPGEAQFVPYILGLMHAPGYLLYTLLGWAWSHIFPLGNVALRMNLFSAIWAALTVAFTYLLARHLSAGKIGAITAAISIASSPLFWEWATMAGVRSMTTFSFALVLYLALLCREKCARVEEVRKRFLILCAAYGLSLAHHQTIVLIAPALIFFLWDVLPALRKRPHTLLLGLAILIACLSLYLYLPIRSLMHPPFDRDKPSTLARFLSTVISWGAATSSASMTGFLLLKRIRLLLSHVILYFRWPGFALGVLGLIYMAKGKLRETGLSLVSYAAIAGFTLAYAPMWGERLNTVFLLPAHLIFALWVGIGVDFLVRLNFGSKILRYQTRAILSGILITFVAIAIGVAGLENYRAIMEARSMPLDIYRQQLRGWSPRRFSELTFNLVAPRALIIADWEQATVLWYLQLIERKRPDVEVVSLDNEGEFEEIVEKARQKGQPIYAARAFPALYGRKYLDNVGPVIQLRENPSLSIPPEAVPLDLNFEGKLALKGYRLWRDHTVQGEVLAITLYWQALTKLKEAYSVSLRLISPDGEEIAQQDIAAPVLGCYPTFLWAPGEVVGDYHELPLKRNWPRGKYELKVIVYYSPAPGVWHNLKAGGKERVKLATFDVNSSQEDLQDAG